MIRSALPLLFLLVISCKNSRQEPEVFKKRKFDETVINKLPLYDSIRQVLLGKHDSISFGNTIGDFQYNFFGDTGRSLSLPEHLDAKVFDFCRKIGKPNIDYITMSRDSLITFAIRSERVQPLDPTETISENLYWLPHESKRYSLQNGVMTRDTINTIVKDTMLSANWKYEISYWKRGGF